MTDKLCITCQQVKPVCCEHKEFYIYCKQCCPWKREHIRYKNSKLLKNKVNSLKANSSLTQNEDDILEIIDLIIETIQWLKN